MTTATSVSFEEALKNFDPTIWKEKIEQAEQLRQEVITRFPLSAWPTMELADYALGQGNENAFCNWLEYRTVLLGSMRGGSAAKHIIYRNKKANTWEFNPRLGSNEQEAWERIRSGFVSAFEMARTGRWDEIDQIDALSSGASLRTKTLRCYFPDDLLPIASMHHLIHFLKLLGSEHATSKGRESVRMNRMLLQILRERTNSQLSTAELYRFLYWWAKPVEEHADSVETIDDQELNLENAISVTTGYIEPFFEEISERIWAKGLRIESRILRRYHLSLKSRGFVILAGLSGTGKTWLAQAYAEAVGAKKELVSVAPNWTTNEDLLGYLNPLHINQYQDTLFSRFLRSAEKEYDQSLIEERRATPYHLILDEMNLARIEYYFAKFLSQMEIRSRDKKATIDLATNDSVALPPNLFFIGTVNIDETTHGFSDKVYDRAQLIELSAPEELIVQHIHEHQYSEVLIQVWRDVRVTAPFAFRVIDDIAKYINHAEQIGTAWEEALDEQILQKILPKVKGQETVVAVTLQQLKDHLPASRFPLTHAKIESMCIGLQQHGFVSYFS